MPAANQVKHLAEFFTSIPWWQLVPAPDLLAVQPGTPASEQSILVSQTDDGRLIVAYTPINRQIVFRTDQNRGQARWVNPVNGNEYRAEPVEQGSHCVFTTPAEGDWLLVIENGR